jgi:antitoxin component YwqK of YwqJK toxin-antitoxin module
MVYEYDDNDRLIERSETPVNYITKKLRIKYGDRSRTEEEYLVYGNKEKLVNIDVYDAQGNLLSRIRYDDDGRQVEKDKFDYVYNKDKKLIEAIRFKNGKLIERTKYSYEYY